MKFNVNQQDLQQALSYCQGVIEKRSTLPILSNVLLDASNSQLTITATDLDVIFVHQIKNIEVIEDGKTTTTSSIMMVMKQSHLKKLLKIKLLKMDTKLIIQKMSQKKKRKYKQNKQLNKWLMNGLIY